MWKKWFKEFEWIKHSIKNYDFYLIFIHHYSIFMGTPRRFCKNTLLTVELIHSLSWKKVIKIAYIVVNSYYVRLNETDKIIQKSLINIILLRTEFLLVTVLFYFSLVVALWMFLQITFCIFLFSFACIYLMQLPFPLFFYELVV